MVAQSGAGALPLFGLRQQSADARAFPSTSQIIAPLSEESIAVLNPVFCHRQAVAFAVFQVVSSTLIVPVSFGAPLFGIRIARSARTANISATRFALVASATAQIRSKMKLFDRP
jgi:hypothetical protein